MLRPTQRQVRQPKKSFSLALQATLNKLNKHESRNEWTMGQTIFYEWPLMSGFLTGKGANIYKSHQLLGNVFSSPRLLHHRGGKRSEQFCRIGHNKMFKLTYALIFGCCLALGTAQGNFTKWYSVGMEITFKRMINNNIVYFIHFRRTIHLPRECRRCPGGSN